MPRMVRKDSDGADRIKVTPTSVRLADGELAELRAVAAGMGVSVSEAARRAILAFTGRQARDIERLSAGDLVTLLGTLHTALRDLAETPAVDPAAIMPVVAEIEAACRAIVARYTRAVA